MEYIVKYSTGIHTEYEEHNIFITSNIDTAKAYVKKFNSILKKWKDYYRRYNSKERDWIRDDVGIQYERWIVLRECNKCFFTEIESR